MSQDEAGNDAWVLIESISLKTFLARDELHQLPYEELLHLYEYIFEGGELKGDSIAAKLLQLSRQRP
ncbi:hypothetical protein [Listeria costaricensis]|uniref:hypothetical protein n=1 Tax=Listeria costaricensis TaxID=2026604 RepID=UPI000C075028|nr:hypothetical protein [Listeria costaricensis]